MPNELIDFAKIFKEIQKSGAEIPEKTKVAYRWTEALSGEGEVVPDSLVWKTRYNDMCDQNRLLRRALMEQSRVSIILSQKLSELGVPPDEVRVLLQER